MEAAATVPAVGLGNAGSKRSYAIAVDSP